MQYIVQMPWSIIKEIATVLYLSVSYETLEERLGDLKNRGVVLNDGQTLKDLYDERTEYYEKYADVTVNEEGLSIRETIDAVKRKTRDGIKDADTRECTGTCEDTGIR